MLGEGLTIWAFPSQGTVKLRECSSSGSGPEAWRGLVLVILSCRAQGGTMQGHDAFVWITQRLYHGDHGIMARCHGVMQPNLNSSCDVRSRYIVTGIKKPRTCYPPIHACPYKHCLIIELCKVQRISSEHEIVARRWKLSRERSQVGAKFPAHHCFIITQHSPQIRLDGHLQPSSV